MPPLLRSLKPYALGVRRDRATGHLYYPVEGVRHYIRFPDETIRARYRQTAFETIYFKEYEPGGTDCVVDIGAGLGTEIIALARRAPGLRYVANEIQPWVYECLCLTLDQLPAGFTPFGLAIGDGDTVRITPTRAGVDASLSDHGAVRVAVVDWAEFKRREGLCTIDLLKMNVEGAEVALLDCIDLRDVHRVIVNVHDFRADRGEGDHFRTRERVTSRLTGAGFVLRPVDADWIFASRNGT